MDPPSPPRAACVGVRSCVCVCAQVSCNCRIFFTFAKFVCWCHPAYAHACAAGTLPHAITWNYQIYIWLFVCKNQRRNNFSVTQMSFICAKQMRNWFLVSISTLLRRICDSVLCLTYPTADYTSYILSKFFTILCFSRIIIILGALSICLVFTVAHMWDATVMPLRSFIAISLNHLIRHTFHTSRISMN